MKKKVTSTVLIFIVGAIWVLIMVKIYNRYGKEVVYEVEEPFEFKNLTKSPVKVKDSAILSLNYPDPFLKQQNKWEAVSKNQKSVSTSSSRRIKKEQSPVVPVTPIQFPVIQYLGNLINSSTNEITAIVKIEGKEYLISGGEKINEVTIVKLTKEQVHVSYKEISRTYELLKENELGI